MSSVGIKPDKAIKLCIETGLGGMGSFAGSAAHEALWLWVWDGGVISYTAVSTQLCNPFGCSGSC